MPARYFVDMHSGLDHPERLLQGILVFLLRHTQEEGELYFNDFSGVKIIFNVRTGYVNTVSLEERQGVTNYYSLEMFPHITTPLIEAISLRVKIDLLWKLKELGDKEIVAIIHKHQIFNESSGEVRDVDRAIVDKTLYEIQTL